MLCGLPLVQGAFKKYEPRCENRKIHVLINSELSFNNKVQLRFSLNKVERFNDRLAVLMTKAMNRLWMFYVFFIISALPIHYTDYKEVYRYFVEFISLVFLPIIMVGQRIMGRAGR